MMSRVSLLRPFLLCGAPPPLVLLPCIVHRRPRPAVTRTDVWVLSPKCTGTSTSKMLHTHMEDHIELAFPQQHAVHAYRSVRSSALTRRGARGRSHRRGGCLVRALAAAAHAAGLVFAEYPLRAHREWMGAVVPAPAAGRGGGGGAGSPAAMNGVGGGGGPADAKAARRARRTCGLTHRGRCGRGRLAPSASALAAAVGSAAGRLLQRAMSTVCSASLQMQEPLVSALRAPPWLSSRGSGERHATRLAVGEGSIRAPFEPAAACGRLDAEARYQGNPKRRRAHFYLNFKRTHMFKSFRERLLGEVGSRAVLGF